VVLTTRKHVTLWGVRRGIILIAALGALALPSSASACSCAPLTEKSVKKADAAAVMKLENVDETGGGTYDEGSGKAAFTYTVGKVFAGKRLAKGDEVTIESNTSSAACGLPKREGKRYGLLLKRKRNGDWISSLCSTTTPKKLRELAAGKRSSARSLCR
jgi:hypothetical protein